MSAAELLDWDELEDEPGAADLDIDAAAEVMGDFKSFCGLVEIKPTDGGLALFEYEAWRAEQQQFEADRTGRDIVCKPRQIGFSTLELARDLHFAVTRIGVNVVVVVHEKKAAEDLFLVVKTMLESLRKIGLAPATKYDSVRQIVFADLNSSIRVLEAGATEQAAAKKGRSGTIHRLHLTELAYWGAAQTTMTALLGCVPASGEVCIESTANGAGGLFYELVQAAKVGLGPYRLHFFAWHRQERYRLAANDGEAFDPRPRDRWETILRAAGCDDDQIRWWRSIVDDAAWGIERALQEYPIDPESCFRTGGGHYISARAIDEMATQLREPKRIETTLRFKKPSNDTAAGELVLDIEVRTYADPVAHRRYVVSGDPSEGVEHDDAGITILDWETGETVAVAWSSRLEAGDFGIACGVLGFRYNTAVVAIERNNHGHAALRALSRELQYPDSKIYRAADRKPGWLTNGATRPVLFDDLRMAIEEGSATTPDARVLGEARTIVKDPADGKPRARNKGQTGGAKDDCFVAWGIGWQVRSKPLPGQRMWDAMARVRAARMGTNGHANGDSE